jgi:hypothetical protein
MKVMILVVRFVAALVAAENLEGDIIDVLSST